MKTNHSGKPQTDKQSLLPEITVRIDRMLDYDGSKVKAIASANIGGAFAVHGLRVIDSQKGLFVQMPQSSYEKNGQRKYSDLFHAVTAQARQELVSAVMEAYQEQLAQGQSADEELPLGPAM